MNGYTKVFAGMLDSTVWQLSKEARLLWITMLLKKDRDQIVRAPVPGLAHAARLTVEETESALEELLRPDKYSQSQEQEGRRVVKVDGGWWVVNGAKYRGLMSAEDRRAYKTAKEREYRAKRKAISAAARGREERFVEADAAGDTDRADAIAAEGLSDATNGEPPTN